MEKISLVIPIYNEELSIKKLIDEINFNLEKKNYQYEVIIVDDGSTDNTKNVLDEILKQYSFVKIIANKINVGQSFSLIEGIKKSKYLNIITLDGDGQNNPKDISKIAKLFFDDENIKLVGGIRSKRKDNIIKRFSSIFANGIRKFILNDDCVDTGCSLKIFDKNIFLMFPKFDGIHRFLPALFKGYGYKTYFINVEHRERKYGYSKYGTFRRMIKGIRDIFIVIKIIKKYKENKNDCIL